MSYYKRVRIARDQMTQKEGLERLEQRIREAEKILMHREFPGWPYIQALIKNKIDLLDEQILKFESLSEIELKLIHKERESMIYFHDIFDQLEEELRRYKQAYERTKAKLETEKSVGVG